MIFKRTFFQCTRWIQIENISWTFQSSLVILDRLKKYNLRTLRWLRPLLSNKWGTSFELGMYEYFKILIRGECRTLELYNSLPSLLARKAACFSDDNKLNLIVQEDNGQADYGQTKKMRWETKKAQRINRSTIFDFLVYYLHKFKWTYIY